MLDNNHPIVESENKNEFDIPKQIITSKYIGVALLAFISIIAGVVLVHLPEKYLLVPLCVFAALIVCAFILTNPFVGVYLYFLYEILRPYDFIPALRPLRLAMIIEILTLISWLIYLAKTRHKVSWSKFNWIFLAFLIVIAFGVITATNNRFAYNTFQSMLVTFIIFVIATNVVDFSGRLNKLIWLLLLIHFYFALKGIYNYAVMHTVVAGQQTSGTVGSGYIGDENDFALALNVMIPFAFFMVIYSRGRIKKLLGLVLLVTFVFGVICSFSRGGWVGLIAALLYCIIKSKRKLASLGFAVLLILALVTLAPSSYWKEVETISNTEEATAAARINYWKAALRMFADHPIIGVGAGNGGIWMPEYVTGFKYPATQWGRAFHGTIPQVMAELGSLGLVCYLLMIFYAVKYLSLMKKRKVSGGDNNFVESTANSVIGGIVAYLVTATFLSTAYYPQLWTLYTIAMILVFVSARIATSSDEKHTEFSLAGRVSAG
jgi:probable O-glycosylation ligase (exosortase A-associated)